MAFDVKRLSTLDRAIAGAAIVAFVAAFLPWWGYDGPGGFYSASVSGWNAGFTAWAGSILLTLTGVYVVLRKSDVKLPDLPAGPAVVAAGAAALGLLLVVIRWLTMPSVDAGVAGSIGPKFGIWVAIIAGIVEVVAAVMAFRASGEALPWADKASPS